MQVYFIYFLVLQALLWGGVAIARLPAPLSYLANAIVTESSSAQQLLAYLMKINVREIATLNKLKLSEGSGEKILDDILMKDENLSMRVAKAYGEISDSRYDDFEEVNILLLKKLKEQELGLFVKGIDYLSDEHPNALRDSVAIKELEELQLFFARNPAIKFNIKGFKKLAVSKIWKSISDSY